MNWYFASRTRHQKSIDKIIDFLKTQNQNIVFEWSKLGALSPFKENAKRSSAVAQEICQALKNVDVFVLISDEAGTDMFIELGIAIGKWLDDKQTKIYAVGKFNDRSLMHFHPAVVQVANLTEVFQTEIPEILKQAGADTITSFNPHS